MTWTNVDPVLCRHMASLDHNVLNIFKTSQDLTVRSANALWLKGLCDLSLEYINCSEIRQLVQQQCCWDATQFKMLSMAILQYVLEIPFNFKTILMTNCKTVLSPVHSKLHVYQFITHWPLGGLNWNFRKVILCWIKWLMGKVFLVKVTSDESHWTLLMMKSTLVQVMAWWRQATSHYLNQCWLRFVSSYGDTRPQWFNYSNMQPCGTVFYWFQELLRLWMLAQRLAETDNEEFLNSVTKVAQIARSSEQLTMLAEAMQNQVL